MVDASSITLLDHLAAYADEPTTAEAELWRVRKNARELRCVAGLLPTGIDLRLLERDDFRRTRLCADVPTLQQRADEWLRALIDRGWSKPRLTLILLEAPPGYLSSITRQTPLVLLHKTQPFCHSPTGMAIALSDLHDVRRTDDPVARPQHEWSGSPCSPRPVRAGNCRDGLHRTQPV